MSTGHLEPAAPTRATPCASGGAPPVLEMRAIRKEFPGVVALDGVDLTLEAGEVHVLLGENGAGKSTLMKILSGAHRKDAGQILMRGREVTIDSPAHALARGIRVIYQELSLVPQLSVAENLFLGALPTKWPGVVDTRELHQRARGLLADLGVAIDPSATVRRLGIAQRQLVEIAKALRDRGPSGAHATSVLVMDEPTSALTAREVDQLFHLIARLTARGVAVVYITHRLDEVYRIGQRVTVMRDGRRVSTGALSATSIEELVRAMANRDVDRTGWRERVVPSAELLRADGLGRRGVLFDISFSLRAGEVLGVAGLLGAGRTELARVLAGADRADSGRLIVAGEVCGLRSPADAIRRGIGLLPEDRKAEGLVPGLTVERNIALPHGRRLGRTGWLPRGCEAAFAAPVVSDLRLKATSGQRVRQLSGGNQQKVVLGKWLAGDTRIVIFDEPTRGIDVGAKAEIYALINRLTAAGAGVIMISSELPELLGMSDRILVMRMGRIAANIEASEASQERILAAALGVAAAGR
jgi:ribose transport system ATP-binding protein